MKKILNLLTFLSCIILVQGVCAIDLMNSFLLTIIYPKNENLPTKLTNKLLLNREDLLNITDKLDSIKIDYDEDIVGPSKPKSIKMDAIEPIQVIITDITNENNSVVYSEFINPSKNIEFYLLINSIANKYDPLYQSIIKN